tara:strand:- start:419 stop:1180 length:762 start_codon:yes stop_codon:yes gene_type:complete
MARITNLILMFLISSLSVSGQHISEDALPSFVFERVLYLKVHQSTGSSFAIEKDGKTLILTAKHLFPNVKENDSLDFAIMKNKEWQTIKGIAHIHSNLNLDALVIDLGYSFFNNKEYDDFLKAYSNIAIGDDCYFFGYPLSLHTMMKPFEIDGYPLPLIKKAIFSGQMENNGLLSPMLDGNNTPGFSGGPIFIKSFEKGTGKSKWSLLGLISGYYIQTNTLLTNQGSWSYNENSGIISVSDIIYITEIINNIK